VPDESNRADHVRIYEVGPRDGLQNEATPIATETKLRFIELLADAGLTEIEATSFVAPTAIPQLADADELLATLPRRAGVRYPVLVPNLRGLSRAQAAGADAIAVFTAASDAFTERNIGMTVAALSRRSRQFWPGQASSAGGDEATSRPPSAARTRARSTRIGRSRSAFICSSSASTRSASVTRSASACRVR
jgi:isopropylmalate/homocitrate/citramalate synthase